MSFSLLVFSPFWGENFLMGLGRKHMGSPFISLPPYLTKHTQKKNFLPIFSPKFSIHPILSPNKHTLKQLVPKRQSEVALVTKLPTITFGAVSPVIGPPTPIVKTMSSFTEPLTPVAM